MQRRWVVFDLDGILVQEGKSENADLDSIRIKYRSYLNGKLVRNWITKRYGLDDFLIWCDSKFNWCVWSCGKPGYVSQVTKTFPGNPRLVWDWTECERFNRVVCKPLKKIMSTYDVSEEDVILIDDSLRNGVYNGDNFLLFPPFDMKKDDFLFRLKRALSFADRVGDLRKTRKFLKNMFSSK